MKVIYSDILLYCGRGTRRMKFEECWVRILFPVQVLIKVHLLSNIRNKCSARHQMKDQNYKHYQNLSSPYSFHFKDLHKINEPPQNLSTMPKNSPKLQRVSSVKYYYHNKEEEQFLFPNKSTPLSV